MSDKIEVTQVDRDTFGKVLDAVSYNECGAEVIARHRIEATAAKDARIAEMKRKNAALRWELLRCEGLLNVNIRTKSRSDKDEQKRVVAIRQALKDITDD